MEVLGSSPNEEKNLFIKKIKRKEKKRKEKERKKIYKGMQQLNKPFLHQQESQVLKFLLVSHALHTLPANEC